MDAVNSKGQALILVLSELGGGGRGRATTQTQDQSYAGGVFMRIIAFSPVTATDCLPVKQFISWTCSGLAPA